MRKLALLALVIVLGLSTSMLAQEHDFMMGGPPNNKPVPTPADIAAAKMKFLGILLNLTQSQKDLGTQLYTAAETSKVPVEASLATAQVAVTTAVLANNAAGITTACNAVGTATAQLELIDANADAAFNQLLTADQKTKFAAWLKGEFVVPGKGKGPKD